MQDFEGRVAVVTGSASGMGLAMAKLFAAQGMSIVMGCTPSQGEFLAAMRFSQIMDKSSTNY